MTKIHDLSVPASSNEEAGAFVQHILKTAQGHILAHHRQEEMWNILVQFGDVQAVKTWLAAQVVTPASKLRSDQKNDTPPDSALFAGFSAAGCRKLGFSKLRDTFFAEGFRQRAEQSLGLGSKNWRRPWTSSGGERVPFDAIIVAAGKPGYLTMVEDGIRNCGAFAAVEVEKGAVKRSPAGHASEHFGFADGVSQPIFFASDLSAPGTSAPNFTLATPLHRVLVEDFFLGNNSESFGSYMAYLRIEQHVERFQQLVDQHAAAQGITPALAAARIIGRHADGRPLAGGAAGLNDFDRKADPNGTQWPFQSHTAKMNPRDGVAHNHRRIVRRAMTYEEGGEKGLLFQSFQSTLDTFEILLRWWAGDPNQPHESGGLDLVLSSPAPPVTTIRGGEYFYFPSIPGLKGLSGQIT